MVDDNWPVLCKRAFKAAAEGNHGYAVDAWMLALQEAEEFGADDERLVVTHTGLYEAYCNQGKYRQAEKPGRQVLDIRRRQYGDDHLQTARAAHNLAVIYQMQQKYGQAEPLYSQALTIKTKALGAGDADVVRLLEGYADLLVKTHREGEAENLLKRVNSSTVAAVAQRSSASVAGPSAKAGASLPTLPDPGASSATEPKTWDDLQQEVEIACGAGKTLEALDILNQAIALAEQFPEKDSRLARSLDRLASLHFASEKYGLAEMVWSRALQIKLRALGNNHPAVADTCNCLAGLHYLLGRFAEAESYTKRCRGIYRTCHGSTHPNVAVCSHNLAILYHVQGRYREAEVEYKTALQIRRSALGKDHPDTLNVMKGYADLLKTLGRHAEAEKLNAAADGLITGSWKAVAIAADQALREEKN